ncbi:zinc finger protein [Vairimorpha apis BRL 01]|uniref:Zinc finger protein n=1 Tax=Vairimorpha apis BRL 01 TaxID=1037528 RepID=T0LC83_9MICR|nr:zinc finger protein [Vairimorpha apis BRL 01]EQB61918.1 zinc finger protein [Vairimorpha apis BRL 01]
MIENISQENSLSNIVTSSTSTICHNCNQEANLKYVTIKEVKPEITVVVFECQICKIKESKIFNDKINNIKLKIECKFNSSEDMKREVFLNLGAKLFIEYDTYTYEHESSLPFVTTVEGLITNAIKAFSDENNHFVGNKTNLNKSLEILQNMKSFTLIIEDNDGVSRVGKIGRGIYEMQDCDIEEFNDEKVKHIFIN